MLEILFVTVFSLQSINESLSEFEMEILRNLRSADWFKIVFGNFAHL